MNESCQISIVSSLYQSASFLDEFIMELMQTLRSMDLHSYEIILVDDGSPDNSLQKALELQKDIPELVVVQLSRNFGHHPALKAGIEIAKGELIYLTDCDMEIRPDKLPAFYEEIKSSSTDMVYGVQDQRRGSWLIRISGSIFWYLLNLVSEVQIPRNMLTERIFNQKVKQALISMGDQHLFLGGMMHWIGFNSSSISFKKVLVPGGAHTLRVKEYS